MVSPDQRSFDESEVRRHVRIIAAGDPSPTREGGAHSTGRQVSSFRRHQRPFGDTHHLSRLE